MSSIDRYLKGKPVQAAVREVCARESFPFWQDILAAALPGILAQHRADVRDEMEQRIHAFEERQAPHVGDQYRRGLRAGALLVSNMADKQLFAPPDEAVAE